MLPSPLNLDRYARRLYPYRTHAHFQDLSTLCSGHAASKQSRAWTSIKRLSLVEGSLPSFRTIVRASCQTRRGFQNLRNDCSRVLLTLRMLHFDTMLTQTRSGGKKLNLFSIAYMRPASFKLSLRQECVGHVRARARNRRKLDPHPSCDSSHRNCNCSGGSHLCWVTDVQVALGRDWLGAPLAFCFTACLELYGVEFCRT